MPGVLLTPGVLEEIMPVRSLGANLEFWNERENCRGALGFHRHSLMPKVKKNAALMFLACLMSLQTSWHTALAS